MSFKKAETLSPAWRKEYENGKHSKYSQDPNGAWIYTDKHGRSTPCKWKVCEFCERGYPISIYHHIRSRCCTRSHGQKLAYATGDYSGENARRFESGRRINRRTGYVEILIPKEERTSTKKYKLEHRIVMEQKEGRKLLPHERVHHKDLNKQNNHPDNLELWETGHSMPGRRVDDMTACPHCNGTGKILKGGTNGKSPV